MSAGVGKSPAAAPEPLDMLGLADGVEVRFKPNLRPDQQRLLGALGVRVIFDDSGYGEDAVKVPRNQGTGPRRPTGNTIRERLLRVLADGERHGTAELARLIDARYDVTCAALSGMVDRGEVFRVKRGIYRRPRATA